jgi:hypothetical protein
MYVEFVLIAECLSVRLDQRHMVMQHKQNKE